MPFTGRLGTDDSELGNIELGLDSSSTQFDRTAADSLSSLSESVSGVLNRARSIADSIGSISESVTRAGTFVRFLRATAIPTRVAQRSTFYSQDNGTAAFPMTLTNGSAIRVGNHLIARLGSIVNSRTVSSVTDPRGNTWTVDRQQANQGNGHSVHIISCHVANAYVDGDVVTVNFNAAQGFGGYIEEYSGIASTDYVDAAGSNGSQVNNFLYSASATTTNASDLAVGAELYLAATGHQTIFLDTGAAQVDNGLTEQAFTIASMWLEGAWKAFTSTGSKTYSGTYSPNSANSAVAIVTYKAAITDYEALNFIVESVSGLFTRSRSLADSISSISESVTRTGSFLRSLIESISSIADSAARGAYSHAHTLHDSIPFIHEAVVASTTAPVPTSVIQQSGRKFNKKVELTVLTKRERTKDVIAQTQKQISNDLFGQFPGYSSGGGYPFSDGSPLGNCPGCLPECSDISLAECADVDDVVTLEHWTWVGSNPTVNNPGPGCSTGPGIPVWGTGYYLDGCDGWATFLNHDGGSNTFGVTEGTTLEVHANMGYYNDGVALVIGFVNNSCFGVGPEVLLDSYYWGHHDSGCQGVAFLAGSAAVPIGATGAYIKAYVAGSDGIPTSIGMTGAALEVTVASHTPRQCDPPNPNGGTNFYVGTMTNNLDGTFTIPYNHAIIDSVTFDDLPAIPVEHYSVNGNTITPTATLLPETIVRARLQFE